MTKACTKCHQEKSLEEFHTKKTAKDGRRSWCKCCIWEKGKTQRAEATKVRLEEKEKYRQSPEYQEEQRRRKEEGETQRRKYREANRDKVLAAKKQYYQENRDEIRQKAAAKIREDLPAFREERRRKRQDDLERRRQYDREYSKQRRQKDLQYRIVGNLRNRIRLSIENKSECTKDLLGCSLEHFVKHLESQFQPGMTWQNYGSYWSIDHIEPCCSFDLSTEDNQRRCFNWRNCRPLTVSENSRKGNSIDREKRIKLKKTPESRVLSE